MTARAEPWTQAARLSPGPKPADNKAALALVAVAGRRVEWIPAFAGMTGEKTAAPDSLAARPAKFGRPPEPPPTV